MSNLFHVRQLGQSQRSSGRMKSLTPILFTLMSCLTTTTSKYRLMAYNCLEPREINKYKRRSMCDVKQEETAERTFIVAQQTRIAEFSGYSCELKYSEWDFRCGAWSHLKLGSVPKVLHTEEVSLEWCRTMVTKKKFKLNQQSESFSIQMNRVNIFPIVVIGSLKEESDSIVCTGENMHYKNALHTNLVILKEFHLTIRPEKFKTDFHTLESTSQHEQLPCSVRAGGCQTGRKTYIYQPPQENCRLQKIRTIKAKKTMNSYWVDAAKGIILNNTGVTRLPGCNFEIRKTQMDDLFLVNPEDAAKMIPLKSDEVEIDLETRMRNEINQYQREVMQKANQRNIGKITCDQTRQETTQKLSFLGGENYIMTAGDIIYHLKCPKVEVELREAEVCYQDIPVKGERMKFMDKDNRVLKLHSPIKPCSTHFPVTIETQSGWVEVNPHIRSTKEPMDYSTETSQPSNHQDVSKMGLYTQTEMRAWEEIISFPTYQAALLTELSWGNCIHQKDCEPNEAVQQFDVSRLYPEAVEMNIWQMMKKKIREYGDTMALLVLVFISLKILVDVLLILMTLYQEGPSAVVALAVSMWMSNQQKYQKIRRRNRRMHQSRRKEDKRNEPEEEIETIM